MANFELGEMQVAGANGLDSLFEREAHILRPHRRRVASIADLKQFIRVAEDTLIHRSEKELWALRKEADGKYFIERLFDDNGEPLKY